MEGFGPRQSLRRNNPAAVNLWAKSTVIERPTGLGSRVPEAGDFLIAMRHGIGRIDAATNTHQSLK
jgi:hypothetical protein